MVGTRWPIPEMARTSARRASLNCLLLRSVTLLRALAAREFSSLPSKGATQAADPVAWLPNSAKTLGEYHQLGGGACLGLIGVKPAASADPVTSLRPLPGATCLSGLVGSWDVLTEQHELVWEPVNLSDCP